MKHCQGGWPRLCTWWVWIGRCVVIGVLLFCGWQKAPAVELRAAQMRQIMQERYGAPGVQRLNNWLDFLKQHSQKQYSVKEQLQAVNDFWNHNVSGGDDAQIWGAAEYWATPLETLGKRMADCEDFVIGKYFSLQQLGMPVEKLRFIYVRARVGGMGSSHSVAHMVLGYYETPQSEPLVLDNLVGQMLPASQRKDLTPVFSFNAQGVYVTGAQPASVERISRWRDLIERMKKEGFHHE